MNKKNILVIVSIIYALVSLFINTLLYSELKGGYKFFYIENIQYGIYISIIPIIFLIKYIKYVKNKDNYFDSTKLENTILALNASILIINIIDIFYCLFVTKKIIESFFPSFMLKYIIVIEIIYLISILWFIMLNKVKTKIITLNKLKIANTILTIILAFAVSTTKYTYTLPIITIVYFIIELIQLFRKNKNPLLEKEYNSMVFATNILMIYSMMFIFLEVEEYISLSGLSTDVLMSILIFKYLNEFKSKKTRIILKIVYSILLVLIIFCLLYNVIPIK